MDSKEKILLVDDDAGILESLRELLIDNYYVSTVNSGEEAIEFVKREMPSLIILDIKLNGIDGFETLKIIRGINEDVPVIMLSGIDKIKTIIDSFRFGANNYVNKPFDINELKKVVSEAVAENNRINSKSRILPVDLELFIKQVANDMSASDTQLDCALQKFREKYVDFVFNKLVAKS